MHVDDNIGDIFLSFFLSVCDQAIDHLSSPNLEVPKK